MSEATVLDLVLDEMRAGIQEVAGRLDEMDSRLKALEQWQQGMNRTGPLPATRRSVDSWGKRIPTPNG